MFLTFCVIFVTLVLQGATMPTLIRRLGLAGAGGPNCEESAARRIVIDAALAHLEEAKGHDDHTAAGAYDHLAEHYRKRQENLGSEAGEHQKYVDLSRETLRVERATAVRLRNEGRINDEVLRKLERELDLTESRMAMADE